MFTIVACTPDLRLIVAASEEEPPRYHSYNTDGPNPTIFEEIPEGLESHYCDYAHIPELLFEPYDERFPSLEAILEFARKTRDQTK